MNFTEPTSPTTVNAELGACPTTTYFYYCWEGYRLHVLQVPHTHDPAHRAFYSNRYIAARVSRKDAADFLKKVRNDPNVSIRVSRRNFAREQASTGT